MRKLVWNMDTGKSFSEALILASTNPQYNNRLSMELPVQYMKTTRTEQVCTYTNWFFFDNSKQFMYPTHFTGNSMNDLSSYCGLIDARIGASDKDLPVLSCMPFT